MKNIIKSRQKILIADDSELNRALLIDILEDEFDIVEVENGTQAVAAIQQHPDAFSLLLLDFVMPEMDGFEVLAFMNKHHWIEDIPVIMITSETSPAYVERAFDFGVTDFISRPFDITVVRHRVSNTMMLAAKQNRLIDIVADQIYENDKNNKLMVTILSHIVEFRNGESGSHVLHIRTITELLLNQLVKITNQYTLSQSDIELISIASALHDIGKISIPGSILNKPGRFTAEEFEVMKSHSLIGAEMLDKLPDIQKNEPLVQVAYEICRWHHERYDGGGYPDGLKGDEIPIAAQVVAIADVYDALTSERCYKKAHSHETAMKMIMAGQCGAFNPLLLDCLSDISEQLKRSLLSESSDTNESQDMTLNDLKARIKDYDLSSSQWRHLQMENDQKQLQFFFDTSTDCLFRYTDSTSLLTFNAYGARLFDVNETILNPLEHPSLLSHMEEKTLLLLLDTIRATTPLQPTVTMDLPLNFPGESRWFRCTLHTLWSAENSSAFSGVVGRLSDIHQEYMQLITSKAALLESAIKFNPSESFSNISGKDIWLIIHYLQNIFDIVRLVDATISYQMSINEQGKIEQTPYQCYSVWERHQRCDNCISAKCLYSKSRLDKFEFINDDIYYVQALYVEIDGQPYALEMVSKITDETLLSGSGREQLVETITNHNTQLYIDPVVGVYNRRYYEEQLSKLGNVEAVAMIDVDNFKKINDSYGHQFGDTALKLIADTISQCVRKSDATIRYGGDEFILIFKQIQKDVFENKIKYIQKKIQEVRVPEYPDLHFSLSIGYAYGPDKVSTLLHQADEQMYLHKNEKKHNP